MSLTNNSLPGTAGDMTDPSQAKGEPSHQAAPPQNPQAYIDLLSSAYSQVRLQGLKGKGSETH